MDFQLAFSLVNMSVIPAWVLLIFLPDRAITTSLVHSMLYPFVLGLAYMIGLGFAVFGGLGAEDGGFMTIEGVRALFSTDIGILVGWAHYLVFDLFVGAWAARDARRRGFSHWMLIPCLLLTFMAGPFGLLLYIILRAATKKGGWFLGESVEPA